MSLTMRIAPAAASSDDFLMSRPMRSSRGSFNSCSSSAEEALTAPSADAAESKGKVDRKSRMNQPVR